MKQKKQDGVTIIEVMISLFTIAMVLIIGGNILGFSNQVSARAKATLAANAIAFSKMQEYENKTFTNIPNGVSTSSYEVEDFSSSIPTESDNVIKSGTGKVYVTPVSPSLKKINIRIDYRVLSETKNLEYATYVQLGGVGR